jgi:hypothetical protein
MARMPTVATLDELTELARRHPRMFVRWSRGPDADAAGKSSDELTGEPLPGLSANPLGCERPIAWIGDRVISEAARTVDEQNARWGPLRRGAAG